MVQEWFEEPNNEFQGDNMEEQGDSRTDQTSAKQQIPPIVQFLQQNYTKLPRFEQLFFEYGSSLVSTNSIVCGVMANNLFRGALKIRKRYLTFLPVTVVPFVFTNIYYEVLVTQPLIQGSLNCPMCAMTRGGYVGVFMGGVAPILLAAFLNLMAIPIELRTRMKRTVVREMISFTKPVFSRLKYFLLFEAVASVFVTSRQVSTIEKLLQMQPVPETKEELVE
ncbi:PREDICTED: transmembrane protein 126A [Nanorana parkeri]|uniref:transmembrane protein 126A n=1 Tax=Nanorana parkeri TaxID=125878 RepID=UPI000853F551|nr:PREDICTED: transmembrane protein 126A [Nanorana parkeri]